MANRLYLMWNSESQGKDHVQEFPLVDDVKIELKSSFKDMEDILPDIIKKWRDMMEGFFKRGSGGSIDIANTVYNQLPVWEKTEPIQLNVKLLFYLKNDAEGDIWEPVTELCSIPIMKKDKNGKNFILPGISPASYPNINKIDKRKDEPVTNLPAWQQTQDLIGLEIPGIIYLDKAIITEAKPTYSKEVTVNGYPIWAEVELSIRSVYPAYSDMLKQSKQEARNKRLFGTDTENKDIAGQTESGFARTLGVSI